MKNTVQTSFVAAVKSALSAKEKLAEIFDKAVAEIIGTKRGKSQLKTLRETLIKWLVDGGVEDKTASNVVSGLMLANEMRIAPGRKSVDADRLKAIAACITLLTDEMDMELKELPGFFAAARREAIKAIKSTPAEEKE